MRRAPSAAFATVIVMSGAGCSPRRVASLPSRKAYQRPIPPSRVRICAVKFFSFRRAANPGMRRACARPNSSRENLNSLSTPGFHPAGRAVFLMHVKSPRIPRPQISYSGSRASRRGKEEGAMRNTLRAALLAAAAAAFAAQAQEYPAKPVTIVVPFAPGGPTDITARALGERLAASLGQQFIVENKPGAGSRLGAKYVAGAAPAGDTLLWGGGG